VPARVPILAMRVGSRLIVTVPGEATKEVGARIRSDVEAAIAGSGIERVVVSGLANEFILYFTTPEEYEQQHYEGGNTHFGEFSSNLLKQELAQLAGTLARGTAAPPAVDFDPTNGVRADGPAYGDGAAAGQLIAQPAPAVPRLGHAALAWQGGPQGLDRPVDRAFVSVQRRSHKRWRRADSDLGLAMFWKVDDTGRHDAFWEVPRNARLGRYRFVVTAKRYRLVSRRFTVAPAKALVVRQVPSARGHVAVEIGYPAARRDQDITWRPRRATGGVVRFRVGPHVVKVKRRRGRKFFVDAPAGSTVRVARGGAHDRWGNTNGAGVALRPAA
jgi:hypothetical protein